MDIDIKKDLTSNWFKLLQNAICDDIVKIEKNKFKFNYMKINVTEQTTTFTCPVSKLKGQLWITWKCGGQLNTVMFV